jgi:hypothetical protein
MTELQTIQSNNIVFDNVKKYQESQLVSKELSKEFLKSLTLPAHLAKAGSEEATLTLLSLAIGQCRELDLPPMSYFNKFFPVNGSMLPSIHVWYHLAARNRIEIEVIEDRALIDREVLVNVETGETKIIKDYRTTVSIKYYNPVLKAVFEKKESVHWFGDIVKAELDKKETYKKYPGAQMKHWCFRNLIRTHRQDILSGLTDPYTAEEMMDVRNIDYSYDSDGNLIQN